MENRKMIFSTTLEHKATMMRDKLAAAGIEALILDQHDSISEVVGSFELYVTLENEEKAKVIVEEMK